MKKVLLQGPFKGLSVRSANILSWHYKDKYQVSISKLEPESIKNLIKIDLDSGDLNLKKVKNCGIKSIIEIAEWLGLDRVPDRKGIKRKLEMKAQEAVESHMNKGADDNDPYWKLFKCKDAVNDAIVEAYKLGYKRGLQEGKK